MKKGGLLGLLAGMTAGGLFAMFTSKRAGADIRKDLLKSWKEGKLGLDTLINEMKGMYDEAGKGLKELSDLPVVKKKLEEVKGQVDMAYKKTHVNISKSIKEFDTHCKKVFEDVKNEVNKKSKQAGKQMKTTTNKAMSAISKTISKNPMSSKPKTKSKPKKSNVKK